MAEVPWAVATMMRERPEVVRRFVDWYVALGARQIFLFFDNPYDLSVNQIVKAPGVHVLRGTTAFWQHLGLQAPASFNRRQEHAMQYAYGICHPSWLICCDADELLHVRAGSVSNMLAREGPAVQAVSLQLVDVVRLPRRPAEILLRLPMTRTELDDSYSPEIAAALAPSVGRVSAHNFRYAVRTGLSEIRIRKMKPQSLTRRSPVIQTVGWHEGAVMQHVMGSSYEDWRGRLYDRLKRKIFAPTVQALLVEVEQKGDEARLKEIYHELYEVSKARRTLMLSRGLIVAPELKVKAPV